MPQTILSLVVVAVVAALEQTLVDRVVVGLEDIKRDRHFFRVERIRLLWAPVVAAGLRGAMELLEVTPLSMR